MFNLYVRRYSGRRETPEFHGGTVPPSLARLIGWQWLDKGNAMGEQKLKRVASTVERLEVRSKPSWAYWTAVACTRKYPPHQSKKFPNFTPIKDSDPHLLILEGHDCRLFQSIATHRKLSAISLPIELSTGAHIECMIPDHYCFQLTNTTDELLSFGWPACS